MRSKEKLYERGLKSPIDDQSRAESISDSRLDLVRQCG